jgi:chaperonin GroES
MKIKPLADRVVIKPSPVDEKSRGGIILPDTANKVHPEVKVGDKVLYGKYSGTEVTIEGEEYMIMREADIFAII